MSKIANFPPLTFFEGESFFYPIYLKFRYSVAVIRSMCYQTCSWQRVKFDISKEISHDNRTMSVVFMAGNESFVLRSLCVLGLLVQRPYVACFDALSVYGLVLCVYYPWVHMILTVPYFYSHTCRTKWNKTTSTPPIVNSARFIVQQYGRTCFG